ncbi:hypothetical protein PVAP13_8KG291200 [Panicum virgatum]|uniref:non-specific serine/threonine protein kinase n=1 Tax=Panicum virgatum TaxID=38727 RepID=A0A8T0PQG3_PANVG|nr:hypothetical protein PVAP13_8KG291200 [Panicum virgatum]
MLIKNASANPSPFAMGSVGAVPDTVYGLFLCRGDVGASDCSQCAATGFHDAQVECIFNKDATLLYDQCLIRYSNEDFLDDLNHRDRDREALARPGYADWPFPGWNESSAENVTAITGVVRVQLQETARQAAFNSTWRYATVRMDVSSTFPALYSLLQCVPDFTPSDCWECLKSISDTAVSLLDGEIKNYVLGVPCSMWYSTVKFYEGKSMLHITPPPDALATEDAARSPKHKTPNNYLHLIDPISKVLVIALVAPLFALFICVIVSFRIMRRQMKGQLSAHIITKMNVHEDEALIWGLEGMNPEFTIYGFSQVLEATGNFSDDNKLGQGGFGPVYKGRFPDGLEIAVKRLASHSGQGFTEFQNEIQLIAKLQHTNLVRLLGCCYQGQEKLLIYEYLPNKSLDFFIFDETRRALVDWNKRQVIIDGIALIAQGLLYLHKHSRLRVIHRDLKASNILLDHEMNPKISDFGLAKIFSKNDTEQNTEDRWDIWLYGSRICFRGPLLSQI